MARASRQPTPKHLQSTPSILLFHPPKAVIHQSHFTPAFIKSRSKSKSFDDILVLQRQGTQEENFKGNERKARGAT